MSDVPYLPPELEPEWEDAVPLPTFCETCGRSDCPSLDDGLECEDPLNFASDDELEEEYEERKPESQEIRRFKKNTD